jgi:hypothetical protein
MKRNAQTKGGEVMSLATTAHNRIGVPATPQTTATKDGTRPTSKRLNAALWVIQGLLAALFLFAGSTKLMLPIEVLTSMGSPNQIVLPGWFIRFIGVAEVLGAIGLILPRLLRILPRLTPLAASGLVIIMVGATSLTFAADGFAPALFPMVVGFLAGFVAYGRRSELLK